MTLIINPGTEKQTNHSEENATKTAKLICEDLGIDETHFRRESGRDDGNGWYGFMFTGAGGEIDVDIPGIDPAVVTEGTPFKSPRLYVGGSSWLYGYALGFIAKGITKEVI